MKLDQLDGPAIVPPKPGGDEPKVHKLEVASVGSVSSTDTGSSLSQKGEQGQQGFKLGKFMSMIQEAERRKKARLSKNIVNVKEALETYRKVQIGVEYWITGEALDKRV